VAVSPASQLSAATRAACAALVSTLPNALEAAQRRTTAPRSATTAAWGDPAITLSCGGASGSPLDEPFSVNGIRWALHDIGAGRTWTTLDRHPAVVITMPDAYENQAELVGALTDALAATR